MLCWSVLLSSSPDRVLWQNWVVNCHLGCPRCSDSFSGPSYLDLEGFLLPWAVALGLILVILNRLPLTVTRFCGNLAPRAQSTKGFGCGGG